MTDFEDLQQRKDELQLRHDIANLERSESMRNTASSITSGSWASSTLASMKVFIRSTFKVATSIFFAALALSTVGGVVWGGSEIWAKHQAAQYEVLREWPLDLQEHLKLNIIARTKLVDGKLLMRVQLDGSPPYLTEPRLRAFNADRTIDLIFQDKDGFPIFRKNLKIGEFSSIVDFSGATVGGDYAFTETFALSDYTKFARLSAEWNIEKVMPKAPPQVPIATKDDSDHCAQNLSRVERLKRLSQHGEVRETGYQTYSAGVRTITFSDSSVIYCN